MMPPRTKIVATVGPASRATGDARRADHGGRRRLAPQLLPRDAGRARRDASAIREAAEAAGREVGVLGDLPGPKLRLGDIEGDVVELEPGREFTLTSAEPLVGNAETARSPGTASPRR